MLMLQSSTGICHLQKKRMKIIWKIRILEHARNVPIKDRHCVMDHETIPLKWHNLTCFLVVCVIQVRTCSMMCAGSPFTMYTCDSWCCIDWLMLLLWVTCVALWSESVSSSSKTMSCYRADVRRWSGLCQFRENYRVIFMWNKHVARQCLTH